MEKDAGQLADAAHELLADWMEEYMHLNEKHPIIAENMWPVASRTLRHAQEVMQFIKKNAN